MITQIINFEGDCTSKEIGIFAKTKGKSFSYRKACKLIKEYSIKMYYKLALEFTNPYGDYTNIKTRRGKKFVHIVHSATDYIFLVE